MNRKHQEHLDTLRRGEAYTAKLVAKSREAIMESLALLQRSDRLEVARKSDRGSRRERHQ